VEKKWDNLCCPPPVIRISMWNTTLVESFLEIG
jgi:hypothetical protein